MTELSGATFDDEIGEPELRLVEILRLHGPPQWWLGYLDTGAHDVVFPGARKLSLYACWPYVVVLAGPDQATTWSYSLPDLMFPVDRSWCVSPLGTTHGPASEAPRR